MTNSQAPRVGERLTKARIARRPFLQRAVGLSLLLSSVPSLLTACGGDDDDDDAPTEEPGPAEDEPEATATSEPAEAESTPEPEEDDEPTETDAEQEPAGAIKDYFGFEIEPAENDDGSSVMQLGFEPNGVNPLNYDGWGAGSAWGYPALMFESMLGLHPDSGEFVPLLATSWDVSDDGLTWTFNLRDDVTWHDGEPFTANDVVFTFETVIIPEVNSYDAGLVADSIAAVEAQDDYTVVMTATGVNSEFLNATYVWLVAEHIWADVAPEDLLGHPGTSGEDPGLVVGTGPFKFVERVPQDHTTLERFDGYWGGRPSIETIVFQYAPESTTAEPLLRTGELDYAWISFQSANQFMELDNVTLHQYFSLDLIQIGLNLDPERTPLFQDKRVRQALLYGLDREAVVEAGYSGHAAIAHSVLLPGMWSHDEAGISRRYDYDPDMALALFEEAGWTRGSDGVLEKDGEKFSFVFSGWEFTEQAQAVVQESWRQIGVEVDSQIMQGEVLSANIADHNFDMFFQYLFCGGSGYDGMLWQMHSSNYPDGGNYNRWINERADELLDALELELDPEQRIPLFTELQNLYLEELPALPMVHDFDNRVNSNRLHNYYPNSYRSVFNAETWWIEE